MTHNPPTGSGVQYYPHCSPGEELSEIAAREVGRLALEHVKMVAGREAVGHVYRALATHLRFMEERIAAADNTAAVLDRTAGFREAVETVKMFLDNDAGWCVG